MSGILGMASAIKFDLAPVVDAEHGGLQQQAQVGSLLSNLPFNQLPEEMRFSPMGGVPPFFRSGIIRIAFMKLTATGMLAGLVAIRATDSDAAFSCALAATVNFVACIHYYIIWMIRAQNPPYAFLSFASGRNKDGDWVGRTETENEEYKMFAQELAVDGLRYSDWAVTLALLTLDLFHLVEHATGGAKSWMDKYVAAGLMPLMVFLGALYRFYANETRGVKEYDIDAAQVMLGIFGFVSSCYVFGLVVDAILWPLMNEACPPGANATLNGKCPITDPELQYDRDAAMFFTWWWVGYPVVSAITWIWGPFYGYSKTAYRSTFKDIMYAVLDVVAKGGLALYVAYRTTWV